MIYSFTEREDDQENAKQNSTAATTNDQDSGEESPPPLPPRRRLEAAAASDEPETKKSRPNEHGMSQTTASTPKVLRPENKPVMRHFPCFLPRKRKAKANSYNAGRQASRGGLLIDCIISDKQLKLKNSY